MRAEVSDENAGADLRHHTECGCQSCRRKTAMRGSGLPFVNNLEDRRGEHDIPQSLPQPRHPHTGQFLSPPHPEDGSRDARGRFLSPADRVDGWSLDNMR
jgi:hypothetical protein